MPYTLDEIGDMVKGFSMQLEEVKKSFQENIEVVKLELNNQMALLQTNVQNELFLSNSQLYEHDIRLSALEKQLIKNDIIITGIPSDINKNAMETFNDICTAIGFSCSSSTIAAIYKLSSENSKDLIITKFCIESTKAQFMKKYINFNQLSTSHIGLNTSTNNRIYINHCLTKRCRDIRAAAKKLRDSGFLAKVQIVRGDVFVTRNGENKPVNIINIGQLKSIHQS